MSRLDIINIGLSICGILVSAAGFAYTLYQVRKTRSAVEAADSATKFAFAGIAGRLTVSEIADMRAGLRGVQTALRGERFETALIQCQAIIEQLHALRTRAGFESDERHSEIQANVVQLAKLRNKLEEKIANPSTTMAVPRANNMLADLGSQLSVWSEELRFEIVTEEQ